MGLSPKVSYRVQSKHETVMFEIASNNRAANDRVVKARGKSSPAWMDLNPLNTLKEHVIEVNEIEAIL